VITDVTNQPPANNSPDD